MPDAEELAQRLSYEFLRDGKYSAAVGPVEVRGMIQAAAAGFDVDMEAEAEAFGNIAVQSVGFEQGTEDPKVHIYLTRGTNALIRQLPSEIEGVKVRAHRMGPVNVRPDAANTSTNYGNLYEKDGRICCGSSCAPTSEASTGTLGALIRKQNSQQIYLLSNNHVFAGCNHVPMDQPILAPSNSDGRAGMRAPGEIGRHHQIHEMRSGNPTFVNPCDADIALALATDDALISSWQGDNVSGYDTPTAVAEPLSLMRVKKWGRTTRLSHGELEARVLTPTPVTYTARHFKGTVWFTNVWTIRAIGGEPFALPGDSGSLVVNEDASRALGLVFAASKSGDYAWMIPMECITRSFGGLSLVGRHGV